MSNSNLPTVTKDDADEVSPLIIMGRIQMANAIGKLTATVSTLEFKKIKESASYKRLKGQSCVDKNGEIIGDVATWDGFCRACGFSRKKVDEDISNLNAFGEEALDVMKHAGIGIREMRQLRTLPDEDLIELEGKVVNAKDTAAVVDVIEDLLTKNQEQKRQFSDVQAGFHRQQKDINMLESENEALHEQLQQKPVNTWPAHTQEIRMESSTLADKAIACIDDLELLLTQVSNPDLKQDDPARFAHSGVAAMAYVTNILGIHAQISRLAGVATDVLKDHIDESHEGMAGVLMPDDEIVNLLNRRNLMIGLHEAEKLARQVRRMNEGDKRGGGRKKSKKVTGK